MLILNICVNTGGVNPDHWFKRVFDTKNLETSFSRDLLKNISKCEVISENLVISDVLGPVSPEWIGSGVKAVLYMKYGDNEFGPIDTHWIGDNLAKYIMDVARDKDIEITTDRFIPFLDDGNYVSGDKVMVKNTGEVYDNKRDLGNGIARLIGGLYEG